MASYCSDVAVFFLGGLQNLIRSHHHAEVDHLEVITLKYYTNDVLADVMHIALYRRQKDLAVAFAHTVFFFFDERDQIGDGLFHHTGGFHHLGQEHLTGTKQVTDDVHPIRRRLKK